ncbi:flagellar type III secretion system protein FlhB [Shimia sp.]|uniref:EscU/YscU/HrcU family type III secretion system export apparatus switch protein n=1 Tax=Shimia sp. TaxID=1954381 RepID=UPI00329995F3
MSGQEDDSEKPFEATPRKLENARKKGEIAKSADLAVAAGYAGLLLAFSFVGAASTSELGQHLSILLDRPHQIAPLIFDGNPATTTGGIFAGIIWPLSPWFAIPAIAVAIILVAQRAVLFTASKVKFKLNRISPIQNAKNKFGRSGLFEFSKSFTKLLIYSVCLGFFMNLRLSDMAGTIFAEPAMAAAMLGQLLLEFLFIVVLIASLIGAVDYFWQRQEHLRKNMMTHKEMTDEFKEAEGDPHIKQQRRQKAQEIAHSQMLADVHQADVIIVNPTHYAVALQWSRRTGEAPVCIAKGVDEIAARIRERGIEAAIPIRSDPPTARALFATVDLGQEIPSVLFRPVATAIRFSEMMRKEARAQR